MASAWAIVRRQGGLLFVQRSQRTSRPGQWCLPGGRIHQHEDAGAAALRELEEEAGLKATLGRFAFEEGGQSYYECLADDEQPVSLKANECQAYRWVTPDELLSLGQIMELRRVVKALRALGHIIHLPPRLEASFRRR